MRKVVRLTENDITRIVNRIINEGDFDWVSTSTYPIGGDDSPKKNNDINKSKKKVFLDRSSKYNVSKEQILNFLNQGKKLYDISKILNVSYGTLYNICKDHDILDKCVGKLGRPIIHNISKEQILDLLNQGNSLSKISKILNTSYETLRSRCEKYGIWDKCAGSRAYPTNHKISDEQIIDLLRQGKTLKQTARILKIPYLYLYVYWIKRYPNKL